MKRLLFIALFTRSLLPSHAVTYYIDWTSGNDASAGTATGTAWKRHPYMNGFAGSYSHSAGDRFIFRGGTTWPRTAFQLNITSGGNSSNRDYYGVDTSWFTGAFFVPPIFDFESIAISGGGSSSAGVLFQNAPFITVEGIDITRHMAPLVFGFSTVSFFGTLPL